MDINTQINRGMEHLLCRREGARLEGMHGLSGMGCADTFNDLSGLLDESGFVGVNAHVAKLRRRHSLMCDRVRKALPVAVDARRLMEETGGDLSGFFSKIGNALKKVAKVAIKLSPSQQLIKKIAPKAALLSPSATLFNALTATKAKPKTQAQVDAAAAAKAAKAAAKQAKKDAKAAAALARANAKNLSPDAAGAAVLANESGVLATPDAQQFAQQLVSSAGGGGVIPDASMTDPGVADAASDGTILGIPTPWAIGGGLALVGIAAYAMRRRGR